MMKLIKTLLFTLFLASMTASSQGFDIKNIVEKRDAAPLALTFTSGFFDGFSEALRYNYAGIDSRYNFNDKFWNPAVSWTNKYKDGNPDNGPAFFGSTSFLVWTTDGYHLTRMIRNTTAAAAITIKIGQRQKWYYYILEAALFYASYCIGFNFSYQFIFKDL